MTSATSSAIHSASSTYAQESDQALVDRLRAGDDDAAEWLIRTYSPGLLATARRYVRGDDDAQDVLQEAFLQALRALDQFRADSRLATWLHRIVINAALMKLRSRRRRPELALDDLLPSFDTEGRHASPVAAWHCGAEAALEGSELRALVRGAIARLPAAYREVIILRDIEGLDTAEAAEALGTTVAAVKVRLHRARIALRALIEPLMRDAVPT